MNKKIKPEDFILWPPKSIRPKLKCKKKRLYNRMNKYILENLHLYIARDYKAYITSRRWGFTKRRLYKQRPRKCEKCENTQRLHVHHLHYNTLGIERYMDLQILCIGCHHEAHDKMINDELEKKLE